MVDNGQTDVFRPDPLYGLCARFDCAMRESSDTHANPANEAHALAHWGGRGAARLVAWDADIGALLLGRIRPGTLLMDRDRSATDDELAITAASRALAAMQAVPAPPAGSFPSFEEKLRWWLDYTAIYGEPEAAGTLMLPLFEHCALRLDASAKRKTLAHGDFIGKNVLLGPDGRYVAVDPLPYIGDPCSDAGQFFGVSLAGRDRHPARAPSPRQPETIRTARRRGRRSGRSSKPARPGATTRTMCRRGWWAMSVNACCMPRQQPCDFT